MWNLWNSPKLVNVDSLIKKKQYVSKYSVSFNSDKSWIGKLVRFIPIEAYNRVEACNTCHNVIPTEAYNRVEACNTCHNVIPTEAYNRVEACNTCHNVIPAEAYNRVEACNTCNNIIPIEAITELSDLDCKPIKK